MLRQSAPDMDILAGRRVTEGHEPRQVRKEAAISDIICVVDRSRSCSIYVSILQSAGSYPYIFVPVLIFNHQTLLVGKIFFQILNLSIDFSALPLNFCNKK